MISLDELDRLEKAATQGEWQNLRGSRIEGVTENGIKRIEDAAFIAALVNFWRSGGREMVRDGERYRWLRSEEVCTNPRYYDFWNRFLESKLVREESMDALIDSARRTSGDERG